jgi:hypothetical protein
VVGDTGYRQARRRAQRESVRMTLACGSCSPCAVLRVPSSPGSTSSSLTSSRSLPVELEMHYDLPPGTGRSHADPRRIAQACSQADALARSLVSPRQACPSTTSL